MWKISTWNWPTRPKARRWSRPCGRRPPWPAATATRTPAIQAYRRIIQLDPGHSEARLAAAETCRLAGRLREALMFCLDLLELDRQHVGCRLEMAESLRRLGRNDDAHAIVEILLVERPEAVPVWCGLARLLAEEGRTAGAEAVLRRALAPGFRPCGLAGPAGAGAGPARRRRRGAGRPACRRPAGARPPRGIRPPWPKS